MLLNGDGGTLELLEVGVSLMAADGGLNRDDAFSFTLEASLRHNPASLRLNDDGSILEFRKIGLADRTACGGLQYHGGFALA
jgi:hypothetical protein